jgi:hypothetical protein
MEEDVYEMYVIPEVHIALGFFVALKAINKQMHLRRNRK